MKLARDLSFRVSRAAARFGLVRGSKAISPTFSLTTDEAAHLLAGLVEVDLAQMGKTERRYGGVRGRFPVLEGIQDKTIRYERFDPEEHWKTWRELEEERRSTGVGTGDCEDLAAAVAAELRFNGIPARTYVYRSGSRLYHVVVKTDRWGLLDPSRAAGMEGNG